MACLLGLRTVTVRQSGRRDDEAHRIGLASADVVWVPQHRDLEPHAADHRLPVVTSAVPSAASTPGPPRLRHRPAATDDASSS